MLFLPALVFMRMLRFSVSTVSSLVGTGSVEPSDIVQWLQKQRRSLRALRFQGLQDIRAGKDADHMKPLNMFDTMFSMLRNIFRQNEPETEKVVIGLQTVSIPTGQYCP